MAAAVAEGGHQQGDIDETGSSTSQSSRNADWLAANSGVNYTSEVSHTSSPERYLPVSRISSLGSRSQQSRSSAHSTTSRSETVSGIKSGISLSRSDDDSSPTRPAATGRRGSFSRWSRSLGRRSESGEEVPSLRGGLNRSSRRNRESRHGLVTAAQSQLSSSSSSRSPSDGTSQTQSEKGRSSNLPLTSIHEDDGHNLVDNRVSITLSTPHRTGSKDISNCLRVLGCTRATEEGFAPAGSSHSSEVADFPFTSEGCHAIEFTSAEVVPVELIEELFPAASDNRYEVHRHHIALSRVVKQLFLMESFPMPRQPGTLPKPSLLTQFRRGFSTMSSWSTASNSTSNVPSFGGGQDQPKWRHLEFIHSHMMALNDYALRFRNISRKVISSRSASIFFMVLTLYAIFAPSTVSAVGTREVDEAFLFINTVVFLVFIIELMLLWAGHKNYLCALPFFLDVVSLASFLLDTYFVIGWAGDLKDGRDILTVWRISRTTRILRIFRLMPRLLPRHNVKLAEKVLARRLYRIFMFLDVDDDGFVNAFDLKCFYLVMLQVCPNLLRHSARDLLATDIPLFREALGDLPQDLHAEDAERIQFSSFKDIILNTCMGLDLLECHLDEIEQEEGVWSATRKLSDQSALRVCAGVLAFVTAVSLLRVDGVRDVSIEQSLAQLDLLARREHAINQWNSMRLCQHASLFWKQHKVLYLSLDGETVIDGDSRCLLSTVLDPKVRIDSIVGALALRDSDFRVDCWPSPEDCPRHMQGSGSVSLVDISETERWNAVLLLIKTLAVLLLLLVSLLVIDTKLKEWTRTLLGPLRWLVDDMMAMSSLDILQLDKPGAHEVPVDFDDARIPAPRKTVPILELQELQQAVRGMRTAIRSWSKYVPPCVVERLWYAGVEATIGVARCHATVLFCDIDGFEEICQDLPADSVIGLLSVTHEKVADVIRAWGGTLLEFVGDEILAGFNAPSDLREHAYAGVSSAQQIHKVLENRQEILDTADLEGHDISIRCRCGVNTGIVLAGNIGSTQRMKYGLLGDGVNLAARLKSLNSRYGTQTLVSESVLNHGDCHRRFCCRPVDVVAVKGKTEPTTVYEVMAPNLPVSCEAAVGDHADAFKLYQNRSFEAACALFQDAGAVLSKAGAGNQVDKPSQLLHARCSAYILEPPPADWDGVVRLEAKSFLPSDVSVLPPDVSGGGEAAPCGVESERMQIDSEEIHDQAAAPRRWDRLRHEAVHLWTSCTCEGVTPDANVEGISLPVEVAVADDEVTRSI